MYNIIKLYYDYDAVKLMMHYDTDRKNMIKQ